MKTSLHVALLALVLTIVGSVAWAQTPPVANADGSITGTLHGNLVGTALTIYQPGKPGVAATVASSSLPNPILSGTTGAISGALLAGACDTGTASITGAATTSVAVASATTSAAPGAAFYVKAQVTSANTVTVSVCAAIDGTPTSSTYLVRVIT